jgi:hypothetical protein
MNSRHLRAIVHRMTMKDRRREKTIRRNRRAREENERLRAELGAKIRANPERYLNSIRMSEADIKLAFYGHDPTGLAPRHVPSGPTPYLLDGPS